VDAVSAGIVAGIVAERSGGVTLELDNTDDELPSTLGGISNSLFVVLVNSLFVMMNSLFVLVNSLFVLVNSLFVMENSLFVMVNSLFVLVNSFCVVNVVEDSISGVALAEITAEDFWFASVELWIVADAASVGVLRACVETADLVAEHLRFGVVLSR